MQIMTMSQNKEERHHRKDWDSECDRAVSRREETEFHTKTPGDSISNAEILLSYCTFKCHPILSSIIPYECFYYLHKVLN